MALSIVKTDCALGAEIRGVDLTRPLDKGVFAQIRQALLGTVTPEPTLTHTVSGGRLNVWAALQSPPPGTPPWLRLPTAPSA